MTAPANAEVGPAPYYHRSDCHICRKQDGLKTGSARLDEPTPGGYVVEDEHFLVEHAPLQESSAGTMIVEARGHLLDFGDMQPTESAELAALLHRLIPAIKTATGADRVYSSCSSRTDPGGTIVHRRQWLSSRVEPAVNLSEAVRRDIVHRCLGTSCTPSACWGCSVLGLVVAAGVELEIRSSVL